MARLNLPLIKWSIAQTQKSEASPVRLGDNYTLTGKIYNSDRSSWQLTIPDLDTAAKDELLSLFKFYAGAESFEWSPHPLVPYKNYTCDEGQVIPQGVNLWEMRVTFDELK